MKNKIKIILRCLYELMALTTPYNLFLKIVNESDELTILGVLLSVVYCIVTINLFEWCFDINNFEKKEIKDYVKNS